MWVLENDGEVFQGKRLWLRPGKKFLFGRTISEDGQFAVVDKTVSRQHLTVEVETVDAANCANARIKSRVTVTDLDTKIGTLLNGEQIRGKGVELKDNENKIALGRFKHHFRINWVPVTLSFSFGTKEQNASTYAGLYDKFGPLDIKVLVDYEPGVTTHLVAKKRNTPRGLQALIDGKYIVHYDTFTRAIINAATIPATFPEDGIPSKSLLEDDFDANFPDPLQYLPPRGAEPTQRDASDYAPNESRRNMFDGYTFVFYERRQFDTLLAPITNGHGKALFKEVLPNQITVNEFAQYVKNVAGDKGLGELEDGSEGKGVVVVRFNPVKGEGSEWFAQFGREVAIRLDHRLIEQNEFLDAILGCDASVLRRHLEVEPSGVESAPPQSAPPPLATISNPHRTTTVHESVEVGGPTGSIAIVQEPPKRLKSRKPVVSRFRGFDDDDDDGKNESLPSESIALAKTTSGASQSQGLFVSQAEGMDVNRDVKQLVDTQARPSKKRQASIIEEAEEEDIMEQIAPAAAALKKRRLADGTSFPTAQAAPAPQKEPPPKSPQKVVKQEMDAFEITRRQREEAAAAAAEREAQKAPVDGMDINEMRHLAIVEEIEVKRTLPPPRLHARADDSERWDDKWNGRKDFKKFRRRGANAPGSREFHRVIVPLEEVKKRDYGIGDEYWLEGSSQRKKKGKAKESQDNSQTQTQPRSQARPADRPVRETMETMAVERRSPAKSATPVGVDEESDIATSPKPRQRLQPVSQKTALPQAPSKAGKSAATTSAKAQPQKKKPRTTIMRKEEKDESDDSDDELRFKFRRRK